MNRQFASIIVAMLAALSTATARTIIVEGESYRLESDQLFLVEADGAKSTADTLGSRDITGRIIDPQGNAVSFATVAIVDANGETAAIRVTDQRGRFD